MHILTIDLEKQYLNSLTCELSELICHTNNFDQATRLIHTQDFAVIIMSYTLESRDRDLVSQLLGLTPLSTKIILIGDANRVPSLLNWQDMGIEVMSNPKPYDITDKIQENIDKFSA